ncbi:MAG TPA: polysaccharide biosynthesis protein, partial [Alphaproteobacteria bacterium]|nr:polysaccharide biosynthesis protein [Alphaproteobacteria bacterium]
MLGKHRGFFVRRNAMVIGHDLVMAGLSFVLAQILRRGWDGFLVFSTPYLAEGLLLFVAVCGLVFWRMGVHRGEWRYASLPDMVKITKAATLAILIFLPLMFVVSRLEAFPRSALAINWLVLLALLGGSRVGYRLLRYGNLGGAFERGGSQRIPVLIVGASDEAEVFIREMARNPRAGYRVVGLIDDDARRAGSHIHGLRIFGGTAGLPETVA